jgi:hypothetical protein
VNVVKKWWKAAVEYVIGWKVTLEIKHNNPELYKFLCSDEARDPANYIERQRPERLRRQSTMGEARDFQEDIGG